MRRPPVLPSTLKRLAKAIMKKHGFDYDSESFRKAKPEGHEYWDSHYEFQFFGNPNTLAGCCGVIEMYECYPPPFKGQFPVELTPEEWHTLFQYNVREVLFCANRRMAIATLIDSQKDLFPFFEGAGFTKVSEGYNPDTNNKVTVWSLSI